MKEPDIALVIGDSIIKKVKKIRGAEIQSLRGCSIEDLKNFMLHGMGRKWLNHKQIVVIHVGTNDLFTLTPEQIFDDLKRLVQEIRRWSTPRFILFSSIIPRPKDFWTTFEKTLAVNKMIKSREDEIGIRYIRSWRPFSRKGLPRRFTYNKDGLHPSKKGAARLGRYIGKEINNHRKDMGLTAIRRRATCTLVSRKPDDGYGFPNERTRTRILFRNTENHPPEPTYGSDEKDIHRPRPADQPKLTLKERKRQQKERDKARLKSTVHVVEPKVKKAMVTRLAAKGKPANNAIDQRRPKSEGEAVYPFCECLKLNFEPYWPGH